ncbi:MAG: rare lipoprotein [Verrucomicrobiota bacterium]|jgi:rare lipoprotein A
MPTARNDFAKLRLAGGIVLLATAFALSDCKRTSTQSPTDPTAKNEKSADVQPAPSAKTKTEKKPFEREGYAVWYDVPVDSLAKRRAGKDELTAAHNRLPLGTMVRVTHLANGRSVIVRITDRGITSHAMIDLCKEAAAELGILREGSARVRIEVLPDDEGPGTAPDAKATAPQP